ncbi:MAG: GH92 family glycosyl hydrolase [Bacteroidales bacterium]|nr:GH92 family glycosyl hydrolase [Bacteroidales bacterium]
MKILPGLILISLTGQLFSQDLIRYVNPLVGTAPAATISAKRHSESASEDKGQTFPGVGRPFGMTQWTPETRTTEIKCISPYYYNDKYITGFRGSHWMSGSCTQDYGSITLMPFSGNRPDTVTKSPVSSYNNIDMVSSPAYCRVLLNNSGILTELTASVRSGLIRFSYPGDGQSCLYIRVNSDEKQGSISVSGNTITARNPVHRIYQGRGESAGFSGWFAITFDKPFEVVHNADGSQFMTISFGQDANVTASIGSSFTGAGAALANLRAEIPYPDFEKLRKETEDVWNKTLGKVKVKGGTEQDMIKFYTALYHCYQLPRIASDIDGSYTGFAEDDKNHIAEGFDYYDDFSMWDTYRALHPLMTILEPERTSHMIKSLIMKAEQGGWMPIFPAWSSYTAAMIGDHASTMIADAWVKGIRDFDIGKAYVYMRKNAFEVPPHNEYVDGKGRRALECYMKYGYIPLEDSVWDAFHRREQVSRTLEYALDDYALSEVARSLGKKDDYKTLKKRASNYRNVFDKSTGYVRGRHADGSWIEPFDPNSKASFICEGTPFQYTWYVPHDVPGLIRLMGGKENFIKKLDKFFEGGYYWHGNETDQQAPFMYAMAGERTKTEILTRRINEEEYGNGPGGLSGNEDAGQMSAWLVFSMIGFYPVCPGSGEYVLTSPAFEEISIELPDGSYFRTESRGMDKNNFLIKSSAMNGIRLKGSTISHRAIMTGGTLLHTISD